MDEDDFDFSDSDLDDLPANTLHHLEANAIRATQQPALSAAESDYGLDDGEEVINLDDDDTGPTHAYNNVAAPQYTPAQEEYTYHDNGGKLLRGLGGECILRQSLKYAVFAVGRRVG